MDDEEIKFYQLNGDASRKRDRFILYMLSYVRIHVYDENVNDLTQYQRTYGAACYQLALNDKKTDKEKGAGKRTEREKNTPIYKLNLVSSGIRGQSQQNEEEEVVAKRVCNGKETANDNKLRRKKKRLNSMAYLTRTAHTNEYR